MDLMEAIKTRRSIRRFKETPVPESLLKEVLNTARLAPSADNAQPWRIIVIMDADLKLKLISASYGQKFIAQAPVLLVVCGVPEETFSTIGGYMNAHVIDVAIAVDHMTLAANALGLGTCWVGRFNEDKVREVLEIPEDVRVIAMIPLGYPDEAPEKTPRRNLDDLVMYEKFKGP